MNSSGSPLRSSTASSTTAPGHGYKPSKEPPLKMVSFVDITGIHKVPIYWDDDQIDFMADSLANFYLGLIPLREDWVNQIERIFAVWRSKLPQRSLHKAIVADVTNAFHVFYYLQTEKYGHDFYHTERLVVLKVAQRIRTLIEDRTSIREL